MRTSPRARRVDLHGPLRLALVGLFAASCASTAGRGGDRGGGGEARPLYAPERSSRPNGPAKAPRMRRDRDGDGITNADDRCPDTAEDRDGFEDVDGCPDPDNDADGVLDVDDKCPLQPRVDAGCEVYDGCPDDCRGRLQIAE